MTNRRRVGHIEEVERSNWQLNLEWRIPGFLDLSKGVNESPPFYFSFERWYIRMDYERMNSNRVVFYLRRHITKETSTGTVYAKMGMRGPNGVPEKCIQITRKLEDLNRHAEMFLCCSFCYRDWLIQQKERLMPDGALTITCEMKIPGTSSTLTGAEFKEARAPISGKLSSEKQDGEKALEDFGQLLASGEHSDITIQVGDEEFRVHRLVIFARSPALSVSLRHECKEKVSGRITVEDCHPEAFRQYIQYLYTGSVDQTLAQKNIFNLYRIADRYLASDLKLRCLKHMREMLCVQTFCETLKFSLMHHEKDLYQNTLDFAAENFQSIVISEDWKDFLREHPMEANKVIVESVGPPCHCSRTKRQKT